MQKIRNRKIIYIIAFMMISLCRTAFLGAQLPTNGLIAYYPFNGNANDESGNGNNPIGQLYNPASDRCGFSSSAYKSNYYIYLPPTNFVGLNEYSYSLWFRADSIPSVDNWILFSVGSPVEGYEQVLSLYSGGTLIGTGSNIGTNPTVTTVSTDPVQAGRWIHVVLTRDNTRMIMFLNGAQINISGPNSLTNNQPANYGTDPKVTIGCQFSESRYNFLGAIDEVRIYDRVLTEEEIEQLYYTECMLSELVGATEVCQGQQNVTYFVDPLGNASEYEWSYSGTGVTINGNDNQITIDFADNATSGTLSVTVTGDFIDAQTRSIAIQVQKLPSDAGIVSGEAAVCQGATGVPYSVPGIENAKIYSWNYSGTGASINGNTNTISIDFAAFATGGILTVAGNNACGDGLASPPFAITVSQLPDNPGPVTGESMVCQGQQGVSYTIPVILNALDYAWNYSGTGFTITQDSNTVTLDFDSTATSGDLTVWGINNCGNSAAPAVFPITVLSIPGNAGNLSGEHAVCLNQIDVLYSVTPIEFATSYLWEYSGTGAALTVKTNTVVMDFSDQATSGNLTVTGRNNCGDGARSPEFLITVSDCSMEPVEITIPNSFTPNGDGVNDVFLIQGLPENSTLIIFDRAGHKLFESFSYANDWDGKDRGGKALISGTYWYVLYVPGQPEEYKGFVYLKR